MNKLYKQSYRGNALILVVGILVLLVLVATAFITKTQSGRATASAQRDSSMLTDRSNTIHREIADEIAQSLFAKNIAATFEAPANSANTRRVASGIAAQRYGHDPRYPYNHAPYAVIPWTNPPDPNPDDPLQEGIPVLGPDNPLGGPSFGDARWLRDTEPQRADIIDYVNQGVSGWNFVDGTPETFSHWQHMTNLSRSGNAWRIVKDISNVTSETTFGNSPTPIIVDLDVPIEQWPSFRPTTAGALGVNTSTGFPALLNGGADNFNRWRQWTTLYGWAAGQLNSDKLPHNFLNLSDLNGDGIQNDPNFGERPLDAYVRGTNRWYTEKWITDTDGDGMTDALWHLYPQSLGSDTKQVIAISVTDNSARGNVNVATSFQRSDYYGTDTARDRHGEGTKGHTPADLAIIGQNDLSFGNVYPWRVGFMDNLANLPGNDMFPNGSINDWVSYNQIGQDGYQVNVDWNTDQWDDRANASLLDELGIEVNENLVNPVFNDATNMLNPTDDLYSQYGRMWYWQLAGRDPFTATYGLRPFTLSDELELRAAEGNNYQFVGSRFERGLNDIIGQISNGAVQNQFIRSDYQHNHEASEYRDQLDNRQLLFDNRHKLTMFNGARNDLLPPWLRWEDRFWNRHDPETLNLPVGYDAFDINKYEDAGVPDAIRPGVYGSIFPMRVAIEGINAAIANGQQGLENAILNWREQSRTKLDLREYYPGEFVFGTQYWWEDEQDGKLLFSERLPMQLLLAMTDAQEHGGSNLGSVLQESNAPLGTYDTPNPDGDWDSIDTNYYQQARLASAGLASNILTYRDEDDEWRQHSALPYTYNSTVRMMDLPLSQAVVPPIIGRQSNDAVDPLWGTYVPFADASIAGPNEPTVEMLGLEAQPFIMEVFVAHVHQAKTGGAPGACCLGSEVCVEVSEDTCLAVLNGNWDATDCDSYICPGGACCLELGGCVFIEQDDCDIRGGDFRGEGISCLNVPCTGACCVDGVDQAGNGECIDVSAQTCAELGAAFAGFDSACASTACIPLGSCCFESATCMDVLSLAHCIDMGGTYNAGIFCATKPCKPGACCLPEQYGACVEVSEDTCTVQLGGVYQGLNTVCEVQPCISIGACCFGSGSCIDSMSAGTCTADGGTFIGGASCADGALNTFVAVPTFDTGMSETFPTVPQGAEVSFVVGEQATGARDHFIVNYIISDGIEANEVTNAVIVLHYEQFSGVQSTVSVSRLTQEWEHLTATWNTFDGVSVWPGGVGAVGDTDGSLGIQTFAVGTSGDVKIHVEEFVQDAILNRDRVLSLLFYKNASDGAESTTQFSTSETVDGASPLLTVQYIIGASPCAAACCFGTAACEEFSIDTCTALGGTYVEGITCEEGGCTGACCFSTGGCENLSQESCESSFDATFLGAGTSCDIASCGIEGACCLTYIPDEIWLNEILYDNSPVWLNEFQYDTVDLAWVNEFHYDNTGVDVDEFIEVAVDTFVDPADVQVQLYDGATGAMYKSHELAVFTVGAEQSGKTIYSLNTALQDDIEGIAIVINGTVVQFISYEGTFTATASDANGLTSVDYGVSEVGTAVGTSIGIDGVGTNFADFAPIAFGIDSSGAVNEGQQINHNELIEIALDAEIDPATTLVEVLLYNGADGTQYDSIDVNDMTVGATSQGMTLYSTLTTLQNGNDGIAIVVAGAVKQFISYEGQFTATDGAAATLVSDNIPITQTSASALASIGLTGSGTDYAEFTWAAFNPRTAGAINLNQTIDPYIEFIEIAIASQVSIVDISVELYGSDGLVYATVTGTDFTLGQAADGMTLYSIEWEEDFLDNGPAGIAIIYDEEVTGNGLDRQFLSYEGIITGAAGEALGMTSSLIPIPLNNATVGTSIGLFGTGSYYSDFAWVEFATNSMGILNSGETFIQLNEAEVCVELSATACLLLDGTFEGKATDCATASCGGTPIRGACCFETGNCQDIDSSTCNELEGVYKGDGVSCIDSPCLTEGACCLESTSCIDLNQSSCEDLGGSFFIGEQCADRPCIGACCLPNGACSDSLELDECLGKAGTYRQGLICADEPCVGACCVAPLTCDLVSDDSCVTMLGGIFQGFGTTCAVDPCGFGSTGACCILGGDGCIEVYAAQCADTGGVYSGDATSCQAVVCLNDVIAGACCLASGYCADVISEAACKVLGGTYQGDNSSCASDPCEGACCLPSGSCVNNSEGECNTLGGAFLGDGTTCSTTPCRGACCLDSGSCADVIMLPTCDLLGGLFMGHGTACSSAPCAGGCCLSPAGCEAVSLSACDGMGGTFLGTGTGCLADPCIEGACCLASGSCLETTQAGCDNVSGTFFNGESCDSNPCLGACCLWAGGCELVSIDTCNSMWDPFESGSWEETHQPGFWNGFGSTCGPGTCQPTGSCCLPSGSCVDIMDVPNADTTPEGFVYYCEEVLGGQFTGGESCSENDCASACCYQDGTCEMSAQIDCDNAGGIYYGGRECDDNVCDQVGQCCLDDGSCLDIVEVLCDEYYGDWDSSNNCEDDQCVSYFIVTDDTDECPQETVAFVQLANPFDREIDLNSYAIELFGQEVKLSGENLILPPATEENPATIILYAMPESSTIVDPLGTHVFNNDWRDFLDIELEDLPDNTELFPVPNVTWSTKRTYYDGLVEEEQNSIALYKFDGTYGVDQQRVLVDRLDPPESLDPFDARIVKDLENEWAKVGDEGYITVTDYAGDRVEAVPNTSALLMQWDRASRAWAADIPDTKRFAQTGWHNDVIDPWEKNPRYVFAAHDSIRSEESRDVTSPDTANPVEIKYTSAFLWSDATTPRDPDDLDGDMNPDSADEDTLADNPDPWIVVEVWSPRAGTYRPGTTVEGEVIGGLRFRKPTYFDMNGAEDPALLDTDPDTRWSYPDKGWYGQRDDKDGDKTASDTPAWEDVDLDDIIQITDIEFDMSMPFPLQMLQKDNDFEQVGEVLNCWLFGHMLEGTHELVEDDSYLVLPVSPLDDDSGGQGSTSVDAGTITTFSEFMYPRWGTEEDWFAPWVAKVENNKIVLSESVNRLRFLPDGDTATPRMMGGRSGLDEFLVPTARNHPWPRLSIASRVMDSFVCDGPGRPDINGDGVGDDLNPVGAGSALPSIHSFYNANGYTGKATPGIININTAPVEVLRMLPHMFKLVHETDSSDSNTLDLVDRNPRALLPESMIQWREQSSGLPNVLGNAGFTGGPDYSNRSTALDLSYGVGPEHTRGFSSPSEIGMLQVRGTVDDVMEPWHVVDKHNSVRDASAWSVDYASWDPFGYNDSTNGTDYSIGSVIGNEVGTPISTEVNRNSYYNQDIIVGDGVSGDFEEMNLLQSGISNLVGTTSDMFTVHFRIRTFKRNSVTGIWDATDLDQIVDDSRYVMLVDRSNVETPSDKPKILYFEKLPN
ncbi:MAG: DNRLRE domain-containing protein [Phycisphaerae bacterium]|nr:DNRLRE domain-containing protein [Phycisphaerae bacterium]